MAITPITLYFSCISYKQDHLLKYTRISNKVPLVINVTNIKVIKSIDADFFKIRNKLLVYQGLFNVKQSSIRTLKL